MKSKKSKQISKSKSKSEPIHFGIPTMYVDAEIEGYLPELVKIYKEDKDMQAVEEALREHLNDLLDFVWNDLDTDLLEATIKKWKPSSDN